MRTSGSRRPAITWLKVRSRDPKSVDMHHYRSVRPCVQAGAMEHRLTHRRSPTGVTGGRGSGARSASRLDLVEFGLSHRWSLSAVLRPTSLLLASFSLCQSRRRRCTNSEWITHRSMKMIVNAHQGANGMNAKFTNTEKMAMKIPSQRAQLLPKRRRNPPRDR